MSRAPLADAADLLPLKLAKADGFGTTLYLDAKENKYVEEFSVSNFLVRAAAGGRRIAFDGDHALRWLRIPTSGRLKRLI